MEASGHDSAIGFKKRDIERHGISPISTCSPYNFADFAAKIVDEVGLAKNVAEHEKYVGNSVSSCCHDDRDLRLSNLFGCKIPLTCSSGATLDQGARILV